MVRDPSTAELVDLRRKAAVDILQEDLAGLLNLAFLAIRKDRFSLRIEVGPGFFQPLQEVLIRR